MSRSTPHLRPSPTGRSLSRYGYRDREIADVVGLVALNLLTGAFNLVAGIGLDEAATR